MLGEIADRRGMEPFGAFILSMTHTPADLLGVYLLAKYGGLFSDLKNCETCRLSVVPLLETIDDLRRGPVLLREMLDVPMVRRSVRAGPWSHGGHGRVFRLQQGWRIPVLQP